MSDGRQWPLRRNCAALRNVTYVKNATRWRVGCELDTESEPLNVLVQGREVVVLGRRVAVALSAEAAAETARRLAEAAEAAAESKVVPIQASQAFSSVE